MANASRSAGGLSKGGAVQAASCERKYNIEPVDCGAKLKGSDAGRRGPPVHNPDSLSAENDDRVVADRNRGVIGLAGVRNVVRRD